MVRPKDIQVMDNDSAKITVVCPFCKKESTITVPYDSAIAYYCNHALAQDAFPTLNIDDRETLISGLCKECQTKAFGE